jgi:hypothetical protein
MATGVRLWVGAVILTCGIVAAANLPFRGTRTTNRSAAFVSRLPQLTRARQRAQALADEWRAVQAASRLKEERVRLRARLATSNPDSDRPFLIMTSADTGATALEAHVGALLDSIWRDLGLAETKITVGVVVDQDEETGLSAPRQESWGPSYLLPDSTDRTVCLVRLVENAGWRRVQRESPSNKWLRPWLKSSLGPCAFLAAYGMPGRSVRSWLSGRGFDLALTPSWDDSVSIGRRRGAWVTLGEGRSWTWWWDLIYQQSFPAVACLAQRVAGCQEAVLATTGDHGQPSAVVMTDRRFWQRQRLIGGTYYLSDVAREVGRDRFLEFWNSSLPVDTALARALRRPVGEWTASWQQRLLPAQLRLGPSAPAGASLLAAFLAAVAVATVALTARKRQAR